MKTTINKTILVQSLALAFSSNYALAQQTAPATNDDVSVVLVTAQSRTQDIKDVPIAIQVMSAQDIQKLGAKDLADLNGYIPGITADDSAPTQPVYSIRGVKGGGDFGIGTESPVGIYENGVYTGKTGGAMLNFIDIQQIEAIKGPQGTLFGRNSAAGAISITTNQPTQELDMLAHIEGGQYRTAKVDAMINAPLSDTTALRLVYAGVKSDGWVKDQVTGDQRGGQDDWATRLSLKQSFGQTKINFSWEHEELNQGATPSFGTVTNPSMPLGGYRGAYTPTYISTLANPFDTPLRDTTDGVESRWFNALTLNVDVPLSGMTFNSITGFREFKTFLLADNSGNDRNDLVLTPFNWKNSHSIEQEFKLSGQSEKLNWVAGVSFYRDQEAQTTGAQSSTGTIDTLNIMSGGSPSHTFGALFGALGAAFHIPGINSATSFPWSETISNTALTQSGSVYGDTIWHVTDASNLTLGLRWSEDKKTMSWETTSRLSPQLDSFLNTYGPKVPRQLGGPYSPASFPSNVLFATAASLAYSPVSQSKSWTNFSPRFVFDHKLDKDTMLFASISQGYQAGGYNIFSPPNPASSVPSARDPSYSPEKMTNFETGTKLSLPNYKANINASFFAYKFNNLQNITLSSNPGGLPTYNVTTSDQKATGLDIDGNIKIGSHLTLFGSLELIDATYTNYTEQGVVGNNANLSGQPVGIPYFTGMLGMNYKWEIFGGHADWNLQGTHTSASRRCSDDPLLACISGPNIETGTATSKVDARLGWQTNDHRYGGALIVNNLFNERYIQYLGGQLTTIGAPYARITPPRYVGIQFTASM